ncbi:amidase [Pseudoalteromonas sp. CNC9-20]|uniref:amidase family protein n=1 Tax=Pseudoalteromonas sp. CNC9-20 TaxID=2917750 RepID=UPI001EF41DAE|nr:amidase [Pseudoalteromonas sp. CNC9-20]
MNHTRLTISALLLCMAFSANAQKTETVSHLQQQLHSEQSSATKLTQHYLTRIDALNDNYRAVMAINNNALHDAQRLDNLAREGQWQGPLHGMAVLVKDNIAVANMATTAGALALAQNVSSADAQVISQLRSAGAIILGKANLSEWANFRSNSSSSGWSTLGGQTANAVDATRSPCGSSSGSAVAVKLGFAPLALATETDGSIVCPAATNGVYALKPSYGQVSRVGVVPLAESQDTVGVMANSLADVLLATQVIAAPDAQDQNHHAFRTINYTEVKPSKAKELTLGYVDYSHFTAETQAVFKKQLKQLERHGIKLIELPQADLGSMYRQEFQVLLYEFKRDVNAYLAATPAQVKVKTLSQLIAFNEQHQDRTMPYFGQELLHQANAIDLQAQREDYLEASQQYRLTARNALQHWFTANQLDAIISPTNSPAWKIDKINGDHYLGGASTLAAVAGTLHITLPLADVQGLPVGFSVMANVGGDEQAIAAAKTIDSLLEHTSL